MRDTPRSPGPAARGSDARNPLRIAMLAPPWIPIPAPGYGGVEAVVELLCEVLVARGHSVTLFAAAGSRSPADVHTPLEQPYPDEIGSSRHECDHVGAAFDAIDEAGRSGRPYDVIHDHSGYTAIAMASRISVPLVHTVHGPITPEISSFYVRHGEKAHLVAISRSQRDSAPAVSIDTVIPNPIAVGDWPLGAVKDGSLLWIGRFDPVKGADRAIEAARLSGRRLIMAGPVQPGQERYFEERIAPHIDGRTVSYVGEVDGPGKRQLYARASATLMPISWAEPFGMVMIESLACGTPVIAFPHGAASEIVIDGLNGRLVADVAGMARAVADIGAIGPGACRESVSSRYDARSVTNQYETVYRGAARQRRPHRDAAAVEARFPRRRGAPTAGGAPTAETASA